MATTNRERIFQGQALLHEILIPFVERALREAWGQNWAPSLRYKYPDLAFDSADKPDWDTQLLCKTILSNWKEIFEAKFGSGGAAQTVRNLVGEIKDFRNMAAHERPISYDDAHRALDSLLRLARAVGADKGTLEALEDHRDRTIDEKRSERARSQVRNLSLVEGQIPAGLKPWREVIFPHRDVLEGTYSQAEFAADLRSVSEGQASREYGDPKEFFGRTFLTEGLKDLLTLAYERVALGKGEPVVELQTNFGGGKTHSMLALFHMFGDKNPLETRARTLSELPGLAELLRERGHAVSELPTVKRVVLVGEGYSPAQATLYTQPDGTVLEAGTLWGRLAYLLGGLEGYNLVREADEARVSPGTATLVALLERFSPALILIDEWVAFLRELGDRTDLRAGSFESNLSFAQSLTQAVARVPNCVLVVSLPASAVEVGGQYGARALEALQKTVGRVRTPWRPATAEESFEIVRRRLFEPVSDVGARDAVLRAFSSYYTAHALELPAGVAEVDYRRKCELAYPIHPTLFEALYDRWGTLDGFQRTRGVLRLMAKVIHTLWRRGDKNLLILPGTLPLDEREVVAELKTYLDDNWEAVLSGEVDGPESLAAKLEAQETRFNVAGAGQARRVARSLFLLSAPLSRAAHPGVDQKQILLSSLQPVEKPGNFADALRKLSDGAMYLYTQDRLSWYSTQPSLNRTARDRADSLEDYEVEAELKARLLKERPRDTTPFAAVSVALEDSADLPDDAQRPSVRLVVLGPQHPHSARDPLSSGRIQALELLFKRGNADRLGQNTLVFLAPDKAQLSNCFGRTRDYLAWKSICDGFESLNLSAAQHREAEGKLGEAEKSLEVVLRETWVWTLAPHQSGGTRDTLTWDESRLSGDGSLVARAARKLTQDMALSDTLSAKVLDQQLEGWLWGTQPHLSVRQLAQYFTRYLYLPRLTGIEALYRAIREGVLERENPYFAYADAFEVGEYKNLRLGDVVEAQESGLLVRLEVARAQLERPIQGFPPNENVLRGRVSETSHSSTGSYSTPSPVSTPARPLPTRFVAYGELPLERPVKHFQSIVDELVDHLKTHYGARVSVRIELEAELEGGMDADLQRVLIENGKALKLGTDFSD